MSEKLVEAHVPQAVQKYGGQEGDAPPIQANPTLPPEVWHVPKLQHAPSFQGNRTTHSPDGRDMCKKEILLMVHCIEALWITLNHIEPKVIIVREVLL